jgi:two-component system, NtrC family, response regulator AtoC
MGLTILVVDDELNFRENISQYLSSNGHEVLQAGSITEAREFIKKDMAELILLDIELPDGYGPDLLTELARIDIRPLVIMVTGYGDIETAVEVMKSGAHDFLTKPVKFDRLDLSIKRAADLIRMRRELIHYRQLQGQESFFVAGKSKEMLDLIEKAKRTALTNTSVLLTGETGTGKEVIARYIHKSGNRASKPFIAIDSGAMQPTVVESELFGYESGAFTSAQKRKLGLMEVADTGILFFDEIASMSTEMQTKLLRALEERHIRRVGGANEIPIDVQVIAASNRNLQDLMKKGEFREDLFYRLNVVGLAIPPLRNRKEDIPELVGFFLRKFNSQMGMNIRQISESALEALMNYDWPGNVRELKNVIERAIIFCDGDTIDLPQLPKDLITS